MNSVRIVYIICHTCMELFFLVIAVAAPTYITPGYYYWTGAAVILFLLASSGFSDRMDSWELTDRGSN